MSKVINTHNAAINLLLTGATFILINAEGICYRHVHTGSMVPLQAEITLNHEPTLPWLTAHTIQFTIVVLRSLGVAIFPLMPSFEPAGLEYLDAKAFQELDRFCRLAQAGFLLFDT